ncbi:GGDEF domain-containing protein [Terriglobus albidus]|uniref:GGDEF domain-containing protein n=1 Tax=Terriglobus albidus TaxID=1592106 RepID=UPI0021E0E6DB|nr:GGDEF domain-containing protein [Terriglobus albidus]
MLNYQTLFICDVATGVVYAGAMSILALHHPQLRAHRWFTAAVLLGLLRNALLGTLGTFPLVLSILFPSLCNIVSFFCIYMGFRWVIVRRPLQSWFWPIFLAIELAVFSTLFLSGFSHTFAFSITPIFALCVLSIQMLRRSQDPDMRTVVRAGITVLIAHLTLIAIRTPMVLFRYDVNTSGHFRPARQDPFWLATLAAMMFISACFFVVYLWFFEREMNRALRLQVRTDARTGLLNVRAMEDEAEREVLRAARKRTALSVLAIDIDFFKTVNDTYGHAVGDITLKRVAEQMLSLIRGGDVLARTGGEEFTILLPETGLTAAQEIAERLRASIATLDIVTEAAVVHLTISIGITMYLGDGDAWPLMHRRADVALYRAKRAGRNCVAVCMEKNWAPTPLPRVVALRAER